MIPRRVFFYHGFESLSFLRFMTVFSFRKHHPDFEICVVVPARRSNEQTWTTGEHEKRYRGPDYSPWLVRLDVTLVPFDMRQIGFGNDLAEVHKSDILRNWLLVRHGGYYSDMDVLYIGRLNIPDHVDTVYCHDGKFYYIGLIGSGRGNAFYRHLWRRSLAAHRDENYQCFGTRLYRHLPGEYRRMFPLLTMHNLPMSAVYPFKWIELHRFFAATELPRDCFGIHWFGGSRIGGRLERNLSHRAAAEDNILYSKVHELWRGSVS